METKMPFGIKFTRAVNIVSIVFNFIISLCLVMIAIPNFIKAAQNVGKQANPILMLFLGVVIFSLFSLPAIILIFINKSLGLLKKKLKTWQIIFSIILLLVFPIGTILYGAILYFMLFDKQTKEAFGVDASLPDPK